MSSFITDSCTSGVSVAKKRIQSRPSRLLQADHVLVERTAVIEALGKNVRLDPLDAHPSSRTLVLRSSGGRFESRAS
jgi:hypothetical protein